jgi:hypothetical protein
MQADIHNILIMSLFYIFCEKLHKNNRRILLSVSCYKTMVMLLELSHSKWKKALISSIFHCKASASLAKGFHIADLTMN